jgi:hypothetical protein
MEGNLVVLELWVCHKRIQKMVLRRGSPLSSQFWGQRTVRRSHYTYKLPYSII